MSMSVPCTPPVVCAKLAQTKGKKMKWLLVFLFIFAAGCAKDKPVENIADTASNTINTMYNTLPKECQTETVQILRDNSLKEVQSLVVACNQQTALLGEKITVRNVIIGALVGLILLYVVGRRFLPVRL